MTIATLIENGGQDRFTSILINDDPVRWPTSILAGGKLFVYGGRYLHRPNGAECFYFESTPTWKSQEAIEEDQRRIESTAPMGKIAA